MANEEDIQKKATEATRREQAMKVEEEYKRQQAVLRESQRRYMAEQRMGAKAAHDRIAGDPKRMKGKGEKRGD
ncbi:MAG: hypothetical protein KGI06_05215 [Candidatus Micrarchaeota archaeon]|nr:hypothetical protein [Candidatus Micrarchaeota archaeon]